MLLTMKGKDNIARKVLKGEINIIKLRCIASIIFNSINKAQSIFFSYIKSLLSKMGIILTSCIMLINLYNE